MMRFLVLCALVGAVEEGEYRQCEQSGFCLRNREASKGYWKILRNSIEFTPEIFQATIFDEKFEKQLLLKIWILKTGIRCRIEPVEEENFPRYDASIDRTVIVDKQLDAIKKMAESHNQTHVFLRCFDTVVTVRIAPFSIEISNKWGKILAINPEDTAVFEHNRDRNKYPRMFDANDFNGFIDKVPNGPTAVAMDFQWFGDAVRLHGLPEHTLNLTLPMTVHRLRRKGEVEYQPISEPIRLFNVDIHRYEIGTPMSMYGSIPFLLARDGAKASGLFWNNPSETWIDLNEERHGVNARFLSEGGYIDFFVFQGPTASDVLKQYTELTGRPQLPQSFLFGYHQSRWGYKTSAEVREVIRKLDESLIPHDSVFLDLDHTDDKLYFTFHPHHFKDIEQLQDDIDPLERKVVALIDPHLRVDYGYPIFEKAFNSKYLIRTRIDSEYTAECWPGESAWVDFLNPWARVWWETLYDFDRYKGSTLSLYAWNDMNEPSVFNVPDHTCPKDVVHYKKVENREIHNIYGHLMISASWGGLVKRDFDEDDRPFILTRSFYAGSQKYAVTWTGDNSATWDQMRNSLPLVMSLGISGMPFSGADVGGFFDTPDQFLLVRWYQLGAWCYPFFRCHSHHKSDRREPYLFTGNFGEAIKMAITDRYSLFNYWYTLARHANLSGAPIVRPLWWEFPHDRRFADVEDRVMLGRSLMVLPVFEQFETQKRVDVPFERWYDFKTLLEKDVKDGITVCPVSLQTIPVLIRGGSIVPMKTWKRRTTYLMFRDPFTLIVALDANQSASGDLYVDDGMTFGFAKGNFIHRRFSYSQNVLSSRPFNISQDHSEFSDEYDVEIERIRVTGLSSAPRTVRDSNGTEMEMEYRDGLLTIHRVKLLVKEDWALYFDFGTQLPPDGDGTEL